MCRTNVSIQTFIQHFSPGSWFTLCCIRPKLSKTIRVSHWQTMTNLLCYNITSWRAYLSPVVSSCQLSHQQVVSRKNKISLPLSRGDFLVGFWSLVRTKHFYAIDFMTLIRAIILKEITLKVGIIFRILRISSANVFVRQITHVFIYLNLDFTC